MRASLRCGGRILSPGSSLLNPRSRRCRVRQMAMAHAAQEGDFEQQALYGNLGGVASAPRGRRERSAAATRRVGRDVAERAKCMTDSEWESVPMDDKHAFVRCMRRMLQEQPTEVTEQQRRRYFETTMADVRNLDPQRTVRDEYERVKLGLPVYVRNPRHSLGVSQAVYDAADASLFEPQNVHKLENAMTHIKQIFADYVRKRREGVGTETERRRLASMTAELNLETQRHLANMFKYAEARLRQVALDERHHQMAEIERLRRLALPMGGGSRRQRCSRKAIRMERLRRVLGRAVGLDMDVAETVLTEMGAREDFLQFCEVFSRLTLGVGFHHGSTDEVLSTYAESLRKLYSMSAGALATLDVVQFHASREGIHPVDWAKRWYERALLLPLQRVPEYKQLLQIQERELAVLKTATAPPPPSEASDVLASRAESEAARARANKVVDIVGKMFMDPRDRRLESLHEKRLRYLAHMQMERQIERVRENARLFDGVELTSEAEHCRELYKRILQRKAALCGSLPAVSPSGGSEGPADARPRDAEDEHNLFNVYDDVEAAALFDKIREIALDVIQQRRAKGAGTAAKVRSLHRIVVERLKGGERSVVEELQCLQRQRRERITQRLLGVVENDVKAEMEWLESMEEAERPPLLPIPEGMSYVSAADVQAWRDIREDRERGAGNPFEGRRRGFQPELFGQTWKVPDRPLLFWGTGVAAVQQALRHAAEDAERRRHGAPLAPPYPCAENPWGWRLANDVLDEG